jgi:hypothetical protein
MAARQERQIPTSQPSVKDKVEALFKLEDSTWREFHQRRSYEWKINFALWASLGTISGFVIKESLELTPWVWVGIAVLFSAYVWWQYGLFTSNKMDQEKRNCYLQAVREDIGVELPEHLLKRPHTSGKTFYENWSHSTQIAITLVLLMFAGYVLTSGPKRPLRNTQPIMSADTVRVILVSPDSTGK